MPVQKRSFSLEVDEASYIDSLVSTGAYADESDVIRASLRALKDREADLEQWLREEVVPIAEAMDANPGRAISGEDIQASLSRRRAGWSREKAR
jgi:antitoxin ParD1/3/4